jgi:gamma-glutamyltranspeptidase / glutathione hydrolase
MCRLCVCVCVCVPRSHSPPPSLHPAHGNAVCLLNSNYHGFGTGIAVNGFGFTLQNRGSNFSLEEGHPNLLAPGKRPYHTIIPCMILRGDGTLYATLGCMGGFMQPQGHAQLVSALLDHQLDPQSAVDAPRFCCTQDGAVCVEDTFPVVLIEELRARGHQVRVMPAHTPLVGRAHIILANQSAEQRVYAAGCDSRSDGVAIGY